MPSVTVKLIYTPRPGWNQVSTPVGENHNSVNVGLDCMYDSGVTLTTYSSKSPVLTPAEALALARALALVAGCADPRWRGWHWEARANGHLLATTPLGEWYVSREDCLKAIRTTFGYGVRVVLSDDIGHAGLLRSAYDRDIIDTGPHPTADDTTEADQ